MTRDQILSKTARDLEDEGLVHFTNTDLSDSIQDGYEVTVLLTECIEKSTTLSTVADQPYYDLSTLISDYYRVFAIYNIDSSRWLDPKGYTTFKTYSNRFECIRGNPREWSPLGYRNICLHPTPDDVHSLILFYKALPDTLLGNTIPQIYLESQEVLQFYSIADLLDQNLEFTKSISYYKKFQERIKEIRYKVDHRSWPDRMLALANIL